MSDRELQLVFELDALRAVLKRTLITGDELAAGVGDWGAARDLVLAWGETSAAGSEALEGAELEPA